MRVRVPLPIKVLLSYLAVLAAGAVPAAVWVQYVFPERLAIQAGHDLATEVRALSATQVTPALKNGGLNGDHTKDLAAAASLLHERVTIIGPMGRIVYDSRPGSASAAIAPEVGAVRAGGRPKGQVKIEVPGVIAARNGRELGAAVLTKGYVVRIARDVTSLEEEAARAARYFRNTLALSISVALLLTFVSVIVVFRPLKKLREVAEEMADGDLSPEQFRSSFGEVADASRALALLGTSLRRRLADAGSGPAMLAQLVEVIPAPLLIFELKTQTFRGADGAALLDRVVAVNGRGRRAFKIEGPSAARRCRALLDDEDFCRAMIGAGDEGVPVPVPVPVDDKVLQAWGLALARPGALPLYVLLGDESPASRAFVPPEPEHVRALSLSQLFADAHRGVAEAWSSAEVALSLPTDWPTATVADVDGRIGRAVEATLRGLPAWLAHPGTICLDVDLTPTSVTLAFDAELEEDTRREVERLIEPLGGRVEVGDEEMTLWLPRA
jgi:hypothetical protein